MKLRQSYGQDRCLRQVRCGKMFVRALQWWQMYVIFLLHLVNASMWIQQCIDNSTGGYLFYSYNILFCSVFALYFFGDGSACTATAQKGVWNFAGMSVNCSLPMSWRWWLHGLQLMWLVDMHGWYISGIVWMFLLVGWFLQTFAWPCMSGRAFRRFWKKTRHVFEVKFVFTISRYLLDGFGEFDAWCIRLISRDQQCRASEVTTTSY